MQTQIFTYVDVVEHLLDWFSVDSTDARMFRQTKRAVESAYRALTGLKRWSCYQKRAQLTVSDDYTTGTIAYDHTGGTYERQVTLTTGTWPTWAKYGQITISGSDYEIEDRKSSSVITLSVNSNPGADVASGTSYTLTRDTYPLPVDCQSIGTLRDVDNGTQPELVTFDELVSAKSVSQSPAWPRWYAILADPNYVGSLAIRLYPPPSEALNYEYMYQRVPRTLQTYQYNTGTVTTSGTSVAGTSTVFTSSMINSVIRFSSSTTAPTSTVGSNPYVAQRVITGYTSATPITLDQALDSEVSGVAYEISDPIDLEAGAMYTAFLRRCEVELAMILNRNDVQKFQAQYQAAEILAREQDSRSFAPQTPSGMGGRRVPERWTVTNET